MDAIEEFWETLLDRIQLDETIDFESVLTKLTTIDQSLSFVVKPIALNMADYDFEVPTWETYLKRMVVVKYRFEITSSGDHEKFAMIDQIVSAGSNYDIPADWTVTKFCSANLDEHNSLISSRPGTLLSLSSLLYTLQKREDDYHLALFMEPDFVNNIKNQDDIDIFRNGVLIWLEQSIGEYHTAKSFQSITILPATEIPKFMQVYDTREPKNGVYLLPELMSCFQDSICRLCKVSENNTVLLDRGTLLEYPYIKGLLCESCFTLLKNFRPMYIKLRQI
jgi:hypothetical protein